ncbi:MAG: hypothetical protein ACOYK1_09415 [Vampirovibrionia bacterium]
MKTNKNFFNQVLNVTNAEYIGEYKVKLAFNDGAKGLVNLENF